MKVIKCEYCDKHFDEVANYVSHLEKKHIDMIPKDMTPYQYYYYMKTKKTHGKCVVCGHDTGWNDKTNKYKRFCENPKCKDKYIATFKNRMIGKYGKVTLLNDPEHQRKMLGNRKISGKYIWSTDRKEMLYTGSYEKSFLEFLDLVMDFDSSDVMAPSPHTYFYTYKYNTTDENNHPIVKTEKHFYIPDFFIPSLNLEIEIKDGGDNPNLHPKIQAVDKVKEDAKDAMMKSNSNSFNYMKITNKDNAKFFKYLEIAKNNFANNIDKPIFLI